MRTTKPISTISYNSRAFLFHQLEELVKSHTICDWFFIEHQPEEDETKEHIHLLVIPNKLVDTMDLQDFFREIDPNNPTLKPLGCMPFQLSAKEGQFEWLLYSEHYKPYLDSIGQSRLYHYSIQDFFCHDADSFEEFYKCAHLRSAWAEKMRRLALLDSNMFDAYELIRSGQIPLQMATQLVAYNRLHEQHTFRNGREGHEPPIYEASAREVNEDTPLITGADTKSTPGTPGTRGDAR